MREERQATGPRVLRIYHSAVVAEYRQRDRCLREDFGFEMHLGAPDQWPEGGRMVRSEPELSGLALHRIPIRGRRNHPNLFWYAPGALRKLLLRVKPDVVDLHEEPFSLAVAAALPVVRRYAPRAAICMYTAQNLPKRYPPPFSWFEARALAAASCAYPCSIAAGARLRARGFTGDLAVIPLGVTLPTTEALPARAGTVVGFVGRLEPYKGGAIAIEAFCRVARDIESSMVIVGGGSEEGALRERAAQSGLGSRIHFTGPLSQEATTDRIATFDVLLVPSLSTPTWQEQFGRVVVEGFAAGCAVIASDSGSLPEVVGDAGLLVPEGDVGALAAALSSLLADPERRNRLSVRARRAAERFSWTAVAAEMAAMYERALAARLVPAATARP